MNTASLQPLAIFRPGRHRAMDGRSYEFSEADLAASAAAYDPKLHEAPLVVGHPRTDDPAWGWVAGLAYAGGALRATPGQVAPEFAEAVNAGRYKKISAAFYHPDSPNNPRPGVYYLRHVGFLGAQPPALKGLGDARFGDDDTLVIAFSDSDPQEEPPMAKEKPQTPPASQSGEPEPGPGFSEQMAELERKREELKTLEAQFAERERRLAEAERAHQRREIEAFVEELVQQGRVTPNHQAGLVAYLAAESAGEVLEFGEGEAKTKVAADAWLRDFLKSLPRQIEYGEHAPAGAAPPPVDDAAIARKARAYKARVEAEGGRISFAEAVDAVTQGKTED